MKNNILKSIILFLLIVVGVSNVWADKGFFSEQQWKVGYWVGNSDIWSDYKNDNTQLDLGCQSTLYLKGSNVQTWCDQNDSYAYDHVVWYWGWSTEYMPNNVYSYDHKGKKGNQQWYFPTDYDLIKNAPNNPGQNTLYINWRVDDYKSSGTSRITFTIPGFTTTNTSQAFDNTTVGSSSSKTISFGTHYGTALTTSNCSLSSKTDFSVTSINESSVTVKFNPTTAGNKSATLTITDQHGKKCTITLSGKTQYAVKYSKGNNGTGNDQTTYKVYGTKLTLADKGYFTRTGYTQTAWNTNAAGTGGTSYALKGIYSTDAAITLYPTWTINQYDVNYGVCTDSRNMGTIQLNSISAVTTTESNKYDYGTALNFTAAPTPAEKYEVEGWYSDVAGTQKINAAGTNTTYNAGTLSATTNVYVKFKVRSDWQWTVTFNTDKLADGNKTWTTGVQHNTVAADPQLTKDGYICGWYTDEACTQKYNFNTPITADMTLYGKWVEYEKCIFFKNNVEWENVYVYTFKGDVWGNDGLGVYPANRYECGQMSKLGESDIYYYVLTNTTDGFNYIAFSEKDMSTNDKFYDTKAVYRGDRTDKMPLFIPQVEQAPREINKNEQEGKAAYYYNEGIWMKYNSKESGYYLNIQNESSTALTAPSKGGYIFTATVYLAAGSGERTLDLTNLQNEVKFSKEQAMTTNSEIVLNKWDNYNAASTLKFTPSATGAYTFTLNLATGKVELQATNPTIVTASEGDFRLIYVEQVVEKNSKNQTVITRKKMHPSDIIRKRTAAGTDIVSLHVYNMNTYEAIKSYSGETKTYYTSPSNSEVILQRWDGTKWEDVEGQGHMVFGPLKTIPSMAMLPSRRNADTENLCYDQGIAKIIADEKYDLGKGGGNGVWNFPIVQDGSGNAHLDREAVARYEGNYYIRTACAAGGWDAYRAESDNQMTYSQYAEGNKEFTHYYCKWVNLNKYVQFVVANNHSEAISDTLLADRTTLLGEALADIMVDSKGIVPEGANIRFSWKEWNNGLHRAYIGGSGEGDKDYLVLHDGSGDGDAAHHLWQFPESGDRLTDNKQTFSDNGGWMYQADVYAQTGTAVKMTAKYPLKANSQTQYFKGTEAETVPLIGGGANDTEKYPIRVLYDFKENRLITAYVPQAEETEDVAIETDLMIIRKDHNLANQLTLNDKTPKYAINSKRTAYGAITFTYDHLSSNSWAAANDKTFYWISFPFDVKLSDAFGFGKYATHWYIEWYDGESRAENGLFLDSGTYWRYVTKSQAKDFVLKANTGYVLWLNVPRIQSDNLFVGETKEISIYFPSMIAIDADFEQYENKDYTVAAHWRPEGSRRYNEDSNWNLIGVPSYANSEITTTFADGINPAFLYTYRPATDMYYPQEAGSTDFQSMYAYMVQFAGTITWAQLINDHDPIPSSIAARQSTADEMHQPMLRVELQQNGKYADQTFVKLQDEDATYNFDMNKDLTKVINKTPNLYSITSDNVDVAGNVMPLAETIVPLGVDLQTAGEYTFAMPDGTEGMTIELIDYETNTRTNLLLDSYSVNLSAGANETRFALHIQPDKVATSVENIGEAKGDNVKKYIIDGKLYMQQGEVLYDAQGHIVR